MLNYANLNDVEFEYLCKDVLSKMLGVQLQRFASGKDGGIDLTDDVHKKNIVVQVKHYIKTDTNGLIRSLENEIEKVKKLQPKQYYVCCSKELTPDKKLQIYSMFSDFMESTAMSECVCIKQLNRVLDKDELKLKLLEMFKDKSILNFFFDTDFQKAAFITEFIASNGIFDESYSSYVMTYVSNIDNVKIDDKHTIWVNLILENILEKKFCSFYKVDKIVKDFALMEQELERFELAELIIYIESIDWLMVDNSRNLFVKSMKKLLKEAIEFYVCEVPVDSYDINIGEFVDDRRYDDEFGGHIDADAVVEDIEDCVKSYVKHDLEEMLQRLPTDIYQLSFITDISISISGVSNLVYGYLNDDYDDEYRYDQYMEDKEIDYIFER